MMTTASEKLALRAIVVLSEAANVDNQPTLRLLRELGHEVSSAFSTEQAIHLLQSAGADLMVVDLPSSGRTRQFLDALSNVAPEQRPRHIAVFSDALDEYVRHFSRIPGDSRVHVFLKPLHVHGLLSVLRTAEGRLSQSA